MYVAPEALSGELVGPLADQYSLATIAYFLLTGALPFPAKTPREMFSQLLSQPPIPLNQAKPGLKFSAPVEAVVMRGLSKEPPKRYADVVEFAREFCQATARRDKRKSRDSRRSLRRSFVRRSDRRGRGRCRDRHSPVDVSRSAGFTGSHSVNVDPLPS